jgi:hypothetical protein
MKQMLPVWLVLLPLVGACGDSSSAPARSSANGQSLEEIERELRRADPEAMKGQIVGAVLENGLKQLLSCSDIVGGALSVVGNPPPKPDAVLTDRLKRCAAIGETPEAIIERAVSADPTGEGGCADARATMREVKAGRQRGEPEWTRRLATACDAKKIPDPYAP